MTDLPPLARAVRPAGSWTGAADRVLLAHAARRLRRRRLVTAAGETILLDLDATRDLVPGEALELDDGRLVTVDAAEETLAEVRGADLARLAWHLGCQRVPCLIATDRIVLPADEGIEAMLRALGGEVTRCTAPFLPDAVPGAAAEEEGVEAAERRAQALRVEREHHFRRVHAHAVHHQTAADLAPEPGEEPD